MKIGISGYFGYQNFGDEIFLETWKQIFHEHHVVALTGYEDINDLDKIIIGGGDLIIPSNFTNAYWRPEFLFKDTYVYGVGIPNNAGVKQEEMLKYTAFLDKCKHIAFRDNWSRDYAIKNGLCGNNSEVVEDIAWAYEIPRIKFGRLSNKKVVGITVRDASILNLDNMIELAKHIVSKDYALATIQLQSAPNQGWSDYNIHQKLTNAVLKDYPNATIINLPECFDINNRLSVLATLDMYITQRMHGCLLNLRVGKQTMTIGKSNKFFRLIEKFGLRDALTDDKIENLIKTFDLIDSGKVNFDIIQDQIKSVEKSSKASLLKFKKIVVGG